MLPDLEEGVKVRRFIWTLLGLTATVILAVVGSVGQPLTPRAHADPQSIVMFNPTVCLALTNGAALGCVGANAFDGAGGQGAVLEAANALGNHDNVITPDDFTSVVTFTGGQIHQNGGASPASLSRLAVFAFVSADAPVTFHTSAGHWAENDSDTWTCTASWDPDCGGPAANGDHVVVAYLACTTATCPTRGDHSFTVVQSNILVSQNFTVVGDARTIGFFTLEKAVQAGVPNDATTGKPVCPLATTVAGFSDALAQAEKTIIIARAFDIDGKAITGAWFNWSTDNPNEAVVAGPITPTLNLGSFGFGAPNIICGRAGATAGTVTVKAQLTKTILGTPGVIVDISADTTSSTIPFNVVGVPSKVTLTADPASIPCDGTTSSTVAAALADASGNTALGGTHVHFDVTILGTASPIDTTTNDKGIASSTITPLTSDAAGVPVAVSVKVGGVTQPDLTQSILVQCTGAVAGSQATGAPGGGTGAGTGGPGAPTGVITAPNTGSGGYTGSGRLTWWPGLLVLLAGIGLLGVRATVGRQSRP